ncbi:hypothetical protein ABR738_35105 [Streptomyces sp. Edi4]|uniref:hypothetical protein n=1 Tax=Streptomyces sp. Edi4 TaxID=3162527 RepID=UPI0033061F38
MPSGHLPHPAPRRALPRRAPGTTAFRPARRSATPLAASAPEIVFEAFRTRYGEVYVRYARVRLDSVEAAELTVRSALESVASQWHLVLREASPAAACWSLVTARIAARSQRPYLLGLLRPREADMFVLRYRLGLPVAEAAAVMGMGVAEFTVRLGGAIRLLASPTGILIPDE